MARKGTWTSLELARLRELFPRSSPQRLARLLGRSPAAVLRRGLAMFAGPHEGRPLGAADDLALREAIGVHEPATIAVLLRRPLEAVRQRLAQLAANLRTGPWDDDELRLLKRVFGTRRLADAALALSRAPEDVAAKAAELCLGKDKAARSTIGTAQPMPRWKPAELAKLRQLYPRRENVEIARLLGRTVASVTNKASQLGLSKSPRALAQMGRRNVARRRPRPSEDASTS